MAENGGTSPKGPRCIALVGPFQSGKTTLLEAILARTGAVQRQGTVEQGSTPLSRLWPARCREDHASVGARTLDRRRAAVSGRMDPRPGVQPRRRLGRVGAASFRLARAAEEAQASRRKTSVLILQNRY